MTAQVLQDDRARRARAHYGVWRALVALPAMLGSLGVVLVMFGFLGRWEPVATVAWLASGGVVLPRVGERWVVVAVLGFRRPSRGEAEELEPLWSAALARSGVRQDALDLYVQRSSSINAYAAGGHAVAVTTGALHEYNEWRLTADELVAVLMHEIGHHRVGETRAALLTSWYAMPWRLTSRFVLGMCFGIAGRRQPAILLAVVVVTAVIIAARQAATDGQGIVAVLLIALAGFGVLCPLAGAYIARRTELAADAFAASCGVGRELADVLDRHAQSGSTPPRARRAWGHHPPVERRIAVLTDRGSGAG